MPRFVKVERAKVMVKDGLALHLKACAKCGIEFYGTEGEVKCEACRGKKKRRAATK
jgi:hypothetical protein